MKNHRIIKQWLTDAITKLQHLNRHRTEYERSYSDPPHERMFHAVSIPPTMSHVVSQPYGPDVVIQMQGDQLVTDLSTLPADCYDALLSPREVYDAIVTERDHQDDKWGKNKPQSLPGFLIVIEHELNEAKLAWVMNVEGDRSALREILQIAATATACLEKYGTTGSAIATNDIPHS